MVSESPSDGWNLFRNKAVSNVETRVYLDRICRILLVLDVLSLDPEPFILLAANAGGDGNSGVCVDRDGR